VVEMRVLLKWKGRRHVLVLRYRNITQGDSTTNSRASLENLSSLSLWLVYLSFISLTEMSVNSLNVFD
jgi:hypothetical protein